MSCLVEGCKNDPRARYSHKEGKICEEHWRKLPLRLRQEYWDTTEFGKNDVPEELANRIRENLDGNGGEQSKAQDHSSPQEVP